MTHQFTPELRLIKPLHILDESLPFLSNKSYLRNYSTSLKVALYTALRKRSPMVTTSYSNSFTIIYQHNIVMLVQKIRENCFDHLKV